MKREKNTDHLSPERIWIELEIDQHFYHNNERETYNSINTTLEFLQKAKKKVEKEGFDEVRVEPTYRENEWGNTDGKYISVYGYRLETDKEYKERLQHIISREKNELKSWEYKKNYYEGKDFVKHLKKYTDKL